MKKNSMKYFLFILTIFFRTALTYGQSNIYHSFPDSNAHWTETNWWVSFPGSCTVTDQHTLFLLGDTVFGSTTYHKIYKSGFISASCPPPGYNYYSLYQGAIRQDTLLKRIYFMPVSPSIEQLLYDLNLNIGDTLPQSYNLGEQDTVFNIDSVLVGSTYHKRFILKSFIDSFPNPDTNYAIIEGVGSTFGLLYPMTINIESGSVLNCFGSSGQYYPANSNCLFAVDVSEFKNKPFNISIVPNPVYTETILQADKPLSNALLSIYNCFGQKVKQQENLSGRKIVFHRDNLISGLYYFQISVENTILKTEKVVIINN